MADTRYRMPDTRCRNSDDEYQMMARAMNLVEGGKKQVAEDWGASYRVYGSRRMASFQSKIRVLKSKIKKLPHSEPMNQKFRLELRRIFLYQNPMAYGIGLWQRQCATPSKHRTNA